MNYMGITRTNYFKAKDKEKLRNLIDRTESDDVMSVWEVSDEKGGFLYGFGGYGDICGFLPPEDLPEDADWDESDLEPFFKGLQEIVCDGDVITIETSGYEGLRYTHAGAVIITPETIEYIGFCDALRDKIHSLPGYEDYALNDTY